MMRCVLYTLELWLECTTICRDEEKAFVKTLNSGRARFEKLADATIAAGGKMLAGKDAFLLWDTFGYPLDLTQVRSSAEVFIWQVVCHELH